MRYGMKSKRKVTRHQPRDVDRELTELRRGLTLAGITYNRQVIEKFRIYIEVLHNYKGRLHLLSHRDYYHIATRHFLTSLMAIPYLEGCRTVCDVGAGAGFPSLPLKIVLPDIECTLFESQKKKACFLRQLIEKLELSQVNIIDERAECFAGKTFDVILLKAVGKIKELLEIIDNLIAPRGRAIFYKSHRVEGEIHAAEKELRKKGYQIQLDRLYTPIENKPLALVILKKKKERGSFT